jgi:serine/threonine-protein kinase
MARLDQQLPVGPELGALRRVIERAGRPDPADRPDAGEFIIGLMAAAEELDRPAPLPLAGTMPKGAAEAGNPDPTLHAAASEPTRADVEALAAPDGAGAPPADETGVLPTVDATNLLAPVLAPPGRVVERIERTPPAREAPRPFDYTFEDDDEESGRRRRRWPWVLLGLLLVAGAVGGGVVAYLANRTVSHEVPPLVGQSVEELQAVAAKNKWELPESPDQNRDDTVPTGNIIETTPAAGEKLAEGGLLRYTVSIGKTLAHVPALVNLPLDQAKVELEKVGLKLAEPPKTEFSETVANGSVIRVDTAVPDIPKGESVPVVVSTGPQPRVIPAGLEGQPLAAVQKALTDMGLKPVPAVPAEEFSDIQVGFVIRLANVQVGQQVPRDTAVQIVVSKGPAPRPIPDVANMTLAQATAALQNSGFKVTFDGDPSRPVLGTDPQAGEVQPVGTSVRIVGRR